MRFRAVFLAAILGITPANAAPQRVVSMNLCTDQLAMLLAAPGQVVSVSNWAAMESASNMVEEAAALTLNSGSAEQIFLMQPDLVLAGTFSNPVTIAMLQRLGIRVELLPAAQSIDGVKAALREMGALLSRDDEAESLIAEFEAQLATLETRSAGMARETAAYHYPNNYTSGSGTLAGDVMERAALDNAAALMGLRSVARIDLERLVMLQPFLIRSRSISGNGIGRSYETAEHPALSALAEIGVAEVEDRWQVCGTPFLTRAIAALIAAREPTHD